MRKMRSLSSSLMAMIGPRRAEFAVMGGVDSYLDLYRLALLDQEERLLTFGVQGGREAGARFQDALKLVTRLVNIGDAKSLACHPASTTHRQLSPEEMKKAGVSEDMVRLSIGIEHIDDILADLDQALAAV